MKKHMGSIGVCVVLVMISGVAAADIEAYYTKVNSGEGFEEFSRTGPYADIVVELDLGRLVFWRGSSFLPYWETGSGREYVDEIVARSGDGTEQQPDKVNTFSRVALIESTPERAVVYWRYLPQFGGDNPKSGVSATKFVEEYFAIEADGMVTRTVKRGTDKIDAWRDPLNRTVQSFRLTSDGIGDERINRSSPELKTAKTKGSPISKGVAGEPVVWWKFDEAQGDAAVESVGGKSSTITGHKSLWKQGVSGTALHFDGYNTEVRLPAASAPSITSGLTLEGWVAVAAYPWNWCPIVQQTEDIPQELKEMKGGQEDADFTFVLSKEDDVGYFLGIDGLGYPGLKVKVGGQWEELVGDTHLERNRWYYVAGTYDGAMGKMALYVDGKLVAEQTVAKGDIAVSPKDVRVGKGKARRPTRPVRANTFVDSYAFDGLIDEVRIYDTALSGSDIAKVYSSFDVADSTRTNPEMEARSLPLAKSSGEFGARYDHLKFYESWDNLWRFGDHPDVVVEFDELPTRFVFWRGVGYIPMLVNENEQWYTNEFNETWDKSGGQGCMEPMSDKESYTNHAKIIENTDARVVVQWRYPLLDVLHVAANYDEDTGWADWSDWYYYIYPDGVAVKQMRLWTDGERNHEWQEGMAILGPNQHPETVLETSPALQLADLDGNVDDHLWVNGPPRDVNYDDKKVHKVNYKAEYDPITIGNFEDGDVYDGEVTEYAVFPSWNHWPVAQMPSDGRYASYPDRTAHSSLTHVRMPTYREDFGDRPFYEKLLMEGMLNQSPEELVTLAKSWLRPAAIEVKSGGSTDGYDRAQRAYVLDASGESISLRLEASDESPVVNPAFVVKNWGDRGASLTYNGKSVPQGKYFRVGHPRTVRDKDLVVWIKAESTEALEITLTKSDD